MPSGVHFPHVNRRVVGPVVLALLAVVALALAAATLPAPVPTATSDGTGDGSGTGVGPGSDGGAGTTGDGVERPAWLSTLIAFLFAFLRVVGVLLLLLFVAAVIAYRDALLSALRDALVRLPRHLALALALVLAGAAYLALLWYLSPASGFPRPAPVRPFPGGGGGSNAPIRPTVPPTTLTVAVVLLVAAGATLILLWRCWADDPPATDDGSDVPSEEAAAVGEAAGRAADRIEADGAADNAVFRAWREMTGLLGADRRTTTPGEFAARAVSAGLNREDVEALTRLFEDVRYGGAEATPADERRAIRTLRRIERAYADGAGDDSDEGGDPRRRTGAANRSPDSGGDA